MGVANRNECVLWITFIATLDSVIYSRLGRDNMVSGQNVKLCLAHGLKSVAPFLNLILAIFDVRIDIIVPQRASTLLFVDQIENFHDHVALEGVARLVLAGSLCEIYHKLIV